MTTINFCGRHGFRPGESTLIGEEYYIVTDTTLTTLTVRDIYWYELLPTRAWNRIKKTVRSNKKRFRDMFKRKLTVVAPLQVAFEPDEELTDMAITVALTILTVMSLSITPAVAVLLYFKYWAAQ